MVRELLFKQVEHVGLIACCAVVVARSKLTDKMVFVQGELLFGWHCCTNLHATIHLARVGRDDGAFEMPGNGKTCSCLANCRGAYEYNKVVHPFFSFVLLLLPSVTP